MNLQEQIAFFEKNDYCVFPDALSRAECERINTACDRHREESPTLWGSGPRLQSVHCILALPELDFAIRHASFFPLAKAVLDDDIAFSEFSVMIRAGAQSQNQNNEGWHRDTAVNANQRLGVVMLSAIFYLTDVDATTARYAVIPGSHARDEKPAPVAPGSNDFVGETEILGPSGTCVLVNSGIWHRGKLGAGPRERRTIHIYYQPTSIPPVSGHNIFPRRLWDVEDAEQRRFYSHFNPLTRAVASDYARDTTL